MPRYARLTAPNLFYHIFNRGIEKKPIFKKSHDYTKFLDFLKRYKVQFDWNVYCYCLMPNHFHLLIQTKNDSLGEIMQSLQTAYGVYFNKNYQRVGPVFSGRYKSIICQKDEYLMQVSKYIHLNPVKAGLVKTPAEYQYSSYKEYIDKNNNYLIDKRLMKRILGDKLSNKAMKNYRSFVEEREDLFVYEPFDKSVEIFGNNKLVTKLSKIS